MEQDKLKWVFDHGIYCIIEVLCIEKLFNIYKNASEMQAKASLGALFMGVYTHNNSH